MRRFAIAIVMLMLAAGLASAHPGHDPAPPVDAPQAIAVLHFTEGNSVQGIVRFYQMGHHKVRVVASMTGLKPDTDHGFHIHEFGDCSASDATSAGGHFNPDKHPHAGPSAAHRHAGDLGNVRADRDGKADYEITVTGISIDGKNSILGRSVIVHAQADDLKTQPTGNAGARVACGVIGVAQPKK